MTVRALRWDRRHNAAVQTLAEVTQLHLSLPRSFPVVFQMSMDPLPSEPLAGKLSIGFPVTAPDPGLVDQRLEDQIASTYSAAGLQRSPRAQRKRR